MQFKNVDFNSKLKITLKIRSVDQLHAKDNFSRNLNKDKLNRRGLESKDEKLGKRKEEKSIKNESLRKGK